MKKNLLLSVLIVCGMQVAVGQTVQKVLIEEHTGAWCGYCPEGALFLNNILTNQPNAIAAAIHDGDGMYNATGGVIAAFYSPAYPQATINRNSDPISRSAWAGAVNTALQQTPEVAVSIDSAGYNFSTRTLTVKVKATFLVNAAGNLRFNVYLTEDDVTGTGSGYNQVNYYNSTVGHAFYGMGNPIIGYVHNHVFRDALGGAWGTASVIPTSVTAGEEFTHTYTKVIPASWDINNMHIIGMVNLHGTTLRPTLNSEEVPFSLATGLLPSYMNGDMNLDVYPNPVSARSTISFSLNETGHVKLEVYSLTGQKIRVLADDVTNSGLHSMYWDGTDASGSPLANGLYVLRLTNDTGASIARRVMVSH